MNVVGMLTKLYRTTIGGVAPADSPSATGSIGAMLKQLTGNGSGQPGTIKSIQRGTITIAASSTSATATITAVNTAKTRLSFLGASPDANFAQALAFIALTNSTTITATCVVSNPANTTVGYEVVEEY